VLPGSSATHRPFPLHKPTRSKGPSLPELPGFIGTLALSDAQTVRHPFWRRSRFATPRPSRASPLTLDSLSGMLCSLPRWTDSVRNGCCNGAPARVLPDSFRLPRSCDGSASTLPLSRPARALHALRPARSLAHHTWTLSRVPARPVPGPAARQLSNSTINYSSGSFPHWESSPFGAHAKTAGATLALSL